MIFIVSGLDIYQGNYVNLMTYYETQLKVSTSIDLRLIYTRGAGIPRLLFQ